MSDLLPAWKINFISKLKKLKNVEFPATELMFKLYEFEQELKTAIELLTPSDQLDDWYIGYSRRVASVKDGANKNILFILLMTFYLFALESMPTVQKENRYVLIFDNIETFDNGQLTMEISEYVQNCYSFIQKIYSELNDKDAFYTRFTAVISMRTSTFLPFGNKQTHMWGGEKYIKRIEFYDFTVEALIKKLKFLQKIKNFQETFLYKTLYNLLSIIVPQQRINMAITDGGDISPNDKYFTTYRYLPLFNNNYRRAMEYLCNALTIESICDIYINLLELLQKRYGKKYDYLVNGIRMMIIRYIFEDLHSNSYLSTIGFSELSGEEQYSMTRMLLEYLYWCEVRFYINNSQSHYEGVSITKLIWVFKHFCDETQIANTLYDISIYVKRNRRKANALYAWAYLIYYMKLDADLSEQEFKDIIINICNAPNKPLSLGGVELNPEQIKVKLSDAGMCFVQHYLRNSEFLMARNNEDNKRRALFSLDDRNDILIYTNMVYKIIRNCIDKILVGGEKFCELYGFKSDNCTYKHKKDNFDVIQCALFIRIQECLDMIREAIDYIDRFRVSYCERNHDVSEINRALLDEIQKFYGLYDHVNTLVLKCSCDTLIREFITLWDGKFDKKCREKLDHGKKIRIERFRPIRKYYALLDEDVNKAIQELKADTTYISVYDKVNPD